MGNVLKLDSFVLSKSEAPESWPSYPVYLRDEAETLKEAKQKMHKIIHKTQSYAYFIDNDDHAKKRSARSTKFFQGKTEMSHQETIEKIMYDDNKIEESREDSSSTSSSDQSEESIKNKSLMKNKKSLNTCKNKYVDVEQNIKMNISANTMSTKAHISTKKSNLKDDATKSSSNNFSQPSTSTDLNNTAGIPNQNIQHIENYQDATFPKEGMPETSDRRKYVQNCTYSIEKIYA